MIYSKITGELIRRFGCRIEVIKDGASKSLGAFIQPLRYKNKIYLDGSAITQGMYDGSHYLMIAPPELKFDGDLDDYVISCPSMNERFTVRKVETYYLMDQPVYLWAVLGRFEEGGE